MSNYILCDTLPKIASYSKRIFCHLHKYDMPKYNVAIHKALIYLTLGGAFGDREIPFMLSVVEF